MTINVARETRSRLSHSAIGHYAERIARQHDAVDDNGRVDVRALAAALGGSIEIGNSEVSLAVHGPRDFTIYLPTHTSKTRDRFSIAHELGHYFLHYRSPDRHLVGQPANRFKRVGKNAAEQQANAFASALLMPERPFRDAYDELGNDWSAIAERFGVSPPAAKVRATFLHLIPRTPR